MVERKRRNQLLCLPQAARYHGVSQSLRQDSHAILAIFPHQNSHRLRSFEILKPSLSTTLEMHQHPRPSPRSSTPATNPTTQPERTNNPRDQPPHRTRSSVDLASYTERAGGEAGAMAGRNEATPAAGNPDKETTKLNQIIQVRNECQQ